MRFFIAVAEEGSLTNAAQRPLYTAQPSLSRQIRDLELEIGAKLLERKPRGVSLTAAGRTFLEHARLVLLQVEVAAEAARRAEQPARPGFTVGFLTGQELIWLPETMRVQREEAPDIDIALYSHSSLELARALMRGKVDVAFLRRETEAADLVFRPLIKEPLMVALPATHRLAKRESIRLQEIAREPFIRVTLAGSAALQSLIDEYTARNNITLKHVYEAESLAAGFSLITSAGGVILCPRYIENLAPSSVVVRPLKGEAPTIDLMMGYNKSNTSPLLKKFVSRANELAALVAKKESSLQR